MFDSRLEKQMESAGVLAVLILESAEDAVPLARALLEGGIRGMELTLRTPAALEGLRRVRAEVPEMLIGAGTLLTPGQVDMARDAGALFGVAPGMNPRVAAAARDAGLPFAPGVCTPTDIEAALENECRILKFFPAEPCGGLGYLKTIAAPFAHLGVRFIPLGGLGPGNAESYLREPAVLALGGSWLAPRELIQARQWPEITRKAREAADVVQKVRG